MTYALRILLTFLLIFTSLCTQAATIPNMEFIENKGQWPDHVEFAVDILGGRLFISKTGITYSFYDPELANMLHGHIVSDDHEDEQHDIFSLPENVGKRIKMHAFDMQFKGADLSGTQFFTGEASPTIFNFIRGNDPSKWGQGARAFYNIEYNDIYECVDVKVSTHDYWLKYDVIVHPGADLEEIRLDYEGLTDISLKQGRLHLKTSFNEIIESIPYAYQRIDGYEIPVEVNYKLVDNEVSFDLPCGYNEDYELVIDPLLIFSTFSGSRADNFGYTAAFDEEGNLYSGGIAFDTGFPVSGGAFETTYSGGEVDIAIIKYDSTGERRVYATYLGGMGDESPHSLVVNKNNELIIYGSTSSADFPTTSGAYDESFNGGSANPNIIVFLPYSGGSDIFLSKLSASGGALESSTYLGGTGDDGVIAIGDTLLRNYGDQFKGDVNVDEVGNIYLATTTKSGDLFANVPASTVVLENQLNGTSDAAIIKMNSDLTNIIFGTYLGGDGEDAAYSIKFDQQKNVYISGGTLAINQQFPTTTGSINETTLGDIDGFVSVISNTGDQLLRSTLLGTPAYDQAYFMGLDSNEDIYVFGQTRGAYPVTPGVYVNPNSGQFIHKINNQLDATVFSTVFGSGSMEPNIAPTAFLVNECDNLYLSGWGGNVNNNNSDNEGDTNGMPTTSNAFSETTDGSDFYLMALSADGTRLLYGSFFGSARNENGGDHVDGGTSRFDKRGIIYQAVCSCGGEDDNFPTTTGAFARVNLGVRMGMERCNNAAFKFDLASLVAEIEIDTSNFVPPDRVQVCFPDEIIFRNESIGGETFIWDFGDGRGTQRQDTTFIRHDYLQPGQYRVKLVAIDSTTCIGVDSTFVDVTVFDPEFEIGNSGTICFGDTYLLQASGAEQYAWTDSEGNLLSNNADFQVTPTDSTTYFVDLFNQGCELRDSIRVDVIPLVDVNIQVNSADLNDPGANGACFGDTIVFENLSVVAERFEWNLGDGTVIIRNDLTAVRHIYQTPGVYTVTLRSIDSKPCIGTDISQVEVNIVQPNFTVVDDGVICEGDTYQLQASGANDYLWTNENDSIISTSSNILVSPSSTTSYFIDLDFNGCRRRDEVRVTVIPAVDISFEIEKITDCFGPPSFKLTNTSGGVADAFVWDLGDGQTSAETEFTYQYDQEGVYEISLTGSVDICDFTETVLVEAFELKVPNVFTPGIIDENNDKFTVKNRTPVGLKIFNRWGKLIYESTEYTDQWDSEPYPSGVYYYEVTTQEGVTCTSWLHLIK